MITAGLSKECVGYSESLFSALWLATLYGLNNVVLHSDDISMETNFYICKKKGGGGGDCPFSLKPTINKADIINVAIGQY